VRRVTLVVSSLDTEADPDSTVDSADVSTLTRENVAEEGPIRLEAVVSMDRARAIVDTMLGSSHPQTAALEKALETLVEREMESGEMYGKLFEHLISLAERILIGRVYDSCQGVQTRAAEHLGIDRNTLHKKLSKHNLLISDTPLSKETA